MTEGFNVTLASTLLDLDTANKQQNAEGQHQFQRADQVSFRTGIKSLDHHLAPFSWRGGRVIGIGNVHDEEQNTQQGRNLLVELIATHLIDEDERRRKIVSSTSNDPTQLTPCVYLVGPASSSTISQIYNTVISRLRQTLKPTLKRPTKENTSTRTISNFLNRADTIPHNVTSPDIRGDGKGTGSNADDEKKLEARAMAILESVSLLQYLDLIGLTESLSEISSSLNEPLAQQQNEPHRPNTIIYIEGLNQMISRIVQQVTSTGRRTTSVPVSMQPPHTGNASHTYHSGDVSSTYTTISMSKLSQSAALLVQIARQIRILTRTQTQTSSSGSSSRSAPGTNTDSDRSGSEILTLVDISVALVSSSSPTPSTPGQTSASPHSARRPSHSTHRDPRNVLNSAFADTKARVPRMQCTAMTGVYAGNTVHNRSGSKIKYAPAQGSINSNVNGADLILNRIVSNALDTIVLVHDRAEMADQSQTDDISGGRGRDAIVEVVRDTVAGDGGWGLGAWAVWPGLGQT